MAEVKSNVSGTVIDILVKVGEKISIDQDIVSVESMKMEMMVPSTAAGVVKEIKVSAEEFIQEGQVLVVLG
ncbi:MAG: acetyl-CoA carboxylase biotin carboxyl carrier protein subunit [Bdellovibrionota bacterium]